MIRHGTAIPVGAGATSRVYKAWDEQNARWVAIKYLIHDDPATRARLLREARAMEALHHPHICPVLGTGEDQGRPYVLMPYLDGERLGDVLPHLPIEARLRLLAQVGDAVHHAHECGLLHRDLKPDNVLVTERDGLPHAWVLDFGLVREVGAASVTETGQVLGTPAFMSPEQARGDVTLDRRSDVFSLGAMLYFALLGRPPFAAPSAAETLLRVMREDPPLPRESRGGMPRRLEGVVATALQKQRARRYDSARAFADDLRRYLAGEAPLARLHRSDRLRRAARRHPIVFGLAAALLAAALPAGFLAARTEAVARERARLAAEIAAETETVRQSLRLAYLLPVHDIEPLRSQARAAAGRLAASAPPDPQTAVRNLRAAAQLHLDMDEPDAAIALLDDALTHAPDDAALLGVLALAHMRTYRAELARLRPLADPALRTRRLAQADRSHLQPARRAWTRAQLGADALPFAAEMAFADADLDRALADLEQVPADAFGVTEAWTAAADIHVTRGIERRWRGLNETARGDFAAADAWLARAVEYARSDPRAHRRRCELTAVRADMLAEDAKTDWPDDLDAACRAAIDVAPRDARVHAAYSHLLAAHAKHGRSRGEEIQTLLARAVAAGERAHTLAPGDAEVAQALALALMRQSTQLRWAGRTDPAPIEHAAAVLAQVTTADGAVDPLLIAGQVEGERAQVLEQSGEDPIAAYRAAIGHMRIAVERAPQAAFLRLNLANALSVLAYALAQRGRPDVELTRQAIAQLQEVVAAQPGRAGAWHSLANSHWDLAMAQSWRGDDARAAIAEADRLFDHAATLAPTQLAIPFNHYNLSLFAAAEALRDGQPAQHWLARAEALAASIDARTQQDWISPCPRAEYALRRLQASSAAGRYEAATHAQAAALLERGLAAQPDSVDCARRRIELASFALPFLGSRQRQREREAAATLHDRHPRSLEIRLAWAGVLAARAAADHADAAALEDAIAALERDTSGNWSARLRPLHARLATLESEDRHPAATGAGLIAEERTDRGAARAGD